jgi:TonB family protein
MHSRRGIEILTTVVLLARVATAEDATQVSDLSQDSGERVPLHTVVPVYPETARRARVEGEVQVCFNVSREGKTRHVAVRSSTNRAFEKPARDAVRQSTYRPLPDDKALSGIKTCRTFRFYLVAVAVEPPAA